MVMVAANRRPDGRLKDTIRNILDTGEFVWSMATHAQRESVCASAQEFEPGVDEFEAVGIGHLPAHFECRVHQSLESPGNTQESRGHLVVAQVVAIHLDDDYITADGRFDVLKARPLARLGYMDDTAVDAVFEMQVPNFRTGQTIEYLTNPVGKGR